MKNFNLFLIFSFFGLSTLSGEIISYSSSKTRVTLDHDLKILEELNKLAFIFDENSEQLCGGKIYCKRDGVFKLKNPHESIIEAHKIEINLSEGICSFIIAPYYIELLQIPDNFMLTNGFLKLKERAKSQGLPTREFVLQEISSAQQIVKVWDLIQETKLAESFSEL